MAISNSWPSFRTQLFPIQKIYSKVYYILCTNTRYSTTIFEVDGAVWTLKSWKSLKQNVTFPWNEKLKLCRKAYVFRSYNFIVVVNGELVYTDFFKTKFAYSIKRKEDYIYAEAILNSSFSASEEFIGATIGLKLMKENSPNKSIVWHLNINSLRNKSEALQFIINRNLLLSVTKLDDSFPLAAFMSKNFGIPYRLVKTQMVEDCYFMFVSIYLPSSLKQSLIVISNLSLLG